MTSEEFKQQHPEQAHLEDNDLWDAMENAMFKQQQGNQVINTIKPFWKRYQLRWLFYRRKENMVFGRNDYTSDKRCVHCKKGSGGARMVFFDFNDTGSIKTIHICGNELVEESNISFKHYLYVFGKQFMKRFWWLLDYLHIVRSSIEGRYDMFGDEAYYVKSRHFDQEWNFVKNTYRNRKWYEYIFIRRK